MSSPIWNRLLWSLPAEDQAEGRQVARAIRPCHQARAAQQQVGDRQDQQQAVQALRPRDLSVPEAPAVTLGFVVAEQLLNGHAPPVQRAQRLGGPREVGHGITLRNAYDRAAQFAAAADPAKCLQLAKMIVRDKALNQRTLLRRNAPPSQGLDHALRDIDEMVPRIEGVESADVLLGVEGNIARAYFSQFSTLLKPRDLDAAWDFTVRNRRPPKDPVNAMLSFAYALLAKECTVALIAEGLDPYWGFYHRPRHGRPALALDLMEPLRPIIADSAVVTAINTGMISESQFTRAASGCCMNDGARKALLRAYESRLDQLVTHPVFDYRCSWRSVIQLQARLLSRWLRGDVASYANIVTR